MDSSKSKYIKFFASLQKKMRSDNTSGPRKPESKAGNADAAFCLPPKMAPVLRYKTWIRPFRGRIGLLISLGVFAALIAALQPLAMRFLIDSVVLADRFPHKEKLTLAVYLSLLSFVLLLSSSLISWLAQLESLSLNMRITAAVRKDAFGKLLKLPLPALEQLKSGGVTNILMQDTQAISGLVNYMIIQPAVLSTRISVTFLMIFFVNWRLAVFSLLLLPLALGLSYFSMRHVRPIYGEIFKKREALAARLIELFRGIRVVRIYSREPRERRHFIREIHFLSRIELMAEKMQLGLYLGWNSMVSLATLIIVGTGSMLSITGMATIGDVLALSIYTALILQPIFELVTAKTTSKKGLAALGRICEVLDQDGEEGYKPGAKGLSEKISHVEFQAVTFGYEHERPILKDICFMARRGETVALVGRSGSGKSTLVDLISRFYPPSAGRILINGLDADEIDVRGYRTRVSIVEQSVTLFDASIAENIGYARPMATRQEIEQAARMAGAHDFIAALPRGYDSRVNEDGRNLSGGEKQRLSIARSLLADPDILILDEATSSLDAETEYAVRASFEVLRRNRITFVIAHRLSTIRSADQILVIEKGGIVEKGSHAELIALRGRYHASCMLQLDQLEEDGPVS